MRTLKFTILSLSLATVMAAAAVSPALGAISQYFTQASPLLIKLIVTLPGLSIIVTSLLVNMFIKRYESKSVAVLGLLLFTAGGAAGFADNIYVILAFRIVVGIGVGLVMPLSTALISINFHSKERAKLMGYSVAINNLGGVIATLLSGVLVSLNWRYTFAIYLFGLVIVALVVLFLPKAEIKRTASGIPMKMMREITPHLLSMFVVMVILCVLPTNFSLVATHYALAPTAWIGVLMSVLNIGAFITGMVSARIVDKMKKYTQFWTGIVFAISFWMISYTGSVILSGLGLFGAGAAIGVIVSLLQSQIALRCDNEHVTAAMSIIGAVIYIGQFISPILIAAIQSVFNWQDMRAPYYLAIAFSAVLVFTYRNVPVTVIEQEHF